MTVGPHDGQTAEDSRVRAIVDQIEDRLGFVPPFFEPATQYPTVLENLWHQTVFAYLDNPLPALFKEKVAAALGRNCAVPYCLMCHSCALRPLGVHGGEIVRLLRDALPGDDEIAAALKQVAPVAPGVPAPGSPIESAVIVLACAIYSRNHLTEASRQALRGLLDGEGYDNLILFIAYNRMCHDWVAAHPEISFELDRRYTENFPVLIAEAPDAVALVSVAAEAPADQQVEVAAARAAEVERLAEYSERRLQEVVNSLQARLSAARESVYEERKLRAELEKTARFAQEVVAIVGHDLRNPLGAISASVWSLLKRYAHDAALVRTLNRVRSGTDRAIRLVSDLLDYSQARIGDGIPVVRRATDVAGLVARAVDELEVTNPGRTIRVDGRAGGVAACDEDRVIQVLINLLGNALTHSPPDSDVVVEVRDEGPSVAIAIRNGNREGAIAADVLPILFEPFRRGAVQAATRRKGVGLGLYIVKQIVDGHGGNIRVDSTPERTIFTVVLPRA
jgi:sigma-B regulation protein RsbU (phosphoserine phosphatase)